MKTKTSTFVQCITNAKMTDIYVNRYLCMYCNVLFISVIAFYIFMPVSDGGFITKPKHVVRFGQYIYWLKIFVIDGTFSISLFTNKMHYRSKTKS